MPVMEQLNLPWKIAAVIAFAAVMVAIYLVWSGIVHSLPFPVVSHLFVALMAFCIGGLLGGWNERRSIHKARDGTDISGLQDGP